MTIGEAVEILEEVKIMDDSMYAFNDSYLVALDMAIDALKMQNLTVEPKLLELEDETKAWLDEMDAVDALGNIANICMDFDGYRTANGLGELINEVRTYAKYCADRLKAREQQHDYETSVEVAQYCERYEPTYNPEDGSM